MYKAPKAQKNDPAKAGKRASNMLMFGPWGRFACYAVHTRFDAVQWFVNDAEIAEPTNGMPAIIRQAPSFEEAIKDFQDLI